jgi:hypothetical protein
MIRKAIAAGGLVALAITGGAVGATLMGTANAATPSPSPAVGHSNEDPAHEAGESAAREAAENNGTATYGGHGGSNEDPAHEAGESAAREAQEDAGGTTAPGTTTAPSTPSTTASPSI